MDTQDVTNPDSVQEADAPEQEVTQGEVTEDSTGEDQEQAAQSSEDDDLEDLEIDGQTIKVHKAVKPLVMMHADYTRKTQEVAEQRRAFEQERQMHHAELATVGRLMSMDEQLGQFSKLDWNTLNAEDPNRAQALWFQYQQLRDTRANLASELASKRQQRAVEQERQRADQLAQARASLAKPDPDLGWDGKISQDRITELDQFAYSVGYTPEQLRGAGPRDVKILNLAKLGLQYLKQQKAAAKTPRVEAQPVQQVKRGNANPIRGLDDRLSTDEWVRRRNKQLAERA